MLRYLLDADIVSELAQPDPDPQVVERVAEHAGAMALPSIVWHELLYRLENMEEGSRRTYLANYLMEVVRPSIPILPYDEAAACWHARARAALEGWGRTQYVVDGMIAAIAATRDMILVTSKPSRFRAFRGLLSVENWFGEWESGWKGEAANR